MSSPPPTQTQFNDVQQVAESRASKVWQYFIVVLTGWVLYTLFFHWHIQEYSGAAGVGRCVCPSLLLVYLSLRKANTSDRAKAAMITHGFLIISGTGLFCCACSDPRLESCLLFLYIGPTISFVLLGVRSAMPWLAVCVIAFPLHSALIHGLADSLKAPVIDENIIKTGVAVFGFWCLQQFEAFYRRRAADLVDLSQSLRAKTEEMESLASTDSLTGLANRLKFRNELSRHVTECLTNNSKMALLLLDMDGFKQINDTLGHAVGDEALVEIAARLNRSMPSGAMIARLGGDEFCVILCDVHGRDEVMKVSRDLHETLNGQYQLSNVECSLGTSIGIALCPDDAETPEKLLAFADTAMFHAKDNHQPCAFYDPHQTAQIMEYRSIQEKLSKALENDEFFLLYQPQVETDSGRIVGAEALLRWRHEGETIPPGQFVTHLESNRKIIEVSRWIIDSVCNQINHWNKVGLRVKVAVNISAVDFHDPGFCGAVIDSIFRHGVDPTQLDFEITEGVLIDNFSLVVEKLCELKKLGISISIDDFGTGYSSLAYLRQLPIDKLKIDREFVKGIPDEDDGTIAATMVLLAKSLDLEVLAEGIETEEQRAFFADRECEQFQGYLASRPVLPAELQNLVIRLNSDQQPVLV